MKPTAVSKHSASIAMLVSLGVLGVAASLPALHLREHRGGDQALAALAVWRSGQPPGVPVVVHQEPRAMPLPGAAVARDGAAWRRLWEFLVLATAPAAAALLLGRALCGARDGRETPIPAALLPQAAGMEV